MVRFIIGLLLESDEVTYESVFPNVWLALVVKNKVKYPLIFIKNLLNIININSLLIFDKTCPKLHQGISSISDHIFQISTLSFINKFPSNKKVKHMNLSQTSP